MLFSSTRISGTGGVVTSVNNLTGAIVLAAGSNITLTPVGNTITISATSSGTIGGSIANTQVAVGSGTNTITGSSAYTFAGSVLTLAGDINLTYTGGGRTIKLGDATGSNSGVDLLITGSNGTTATNGGNITLKAGTSASGVDGSVIFVDPSSSAQAVFTLDNLTGSRTYTFPDANGALLNGTLLATQLAYGGSTTNTIASSANMTFDSTNVLLSLTHAGLATTPSTATILQNTTTASLAVPVQISPALEFKGAMWQSGGGGSAHVGTFRMYQIPQNGATAGGTTAGALQIDVSKDGSYTTNILKLTNGGALTTFGGITATNGGITASAGSVTALNQVIAGTDLQTGTNGSASGHLYIYGATTGVLNLTAPANVTNYGVTLPTAQNTYSTGILTADTSGVFSWNTFGLLAGSIVQPNYGTTIDYSAGLTTVGDIEISGSTGATSVLLPTGTIAAIGTVVVISDFDAIAATSNITVDAGTSNTIHAGTIAQTFVMATNGQSITLKKITATTWKSQ